MLRRIPIVSWRKVHLYNLKIMKIFQIQISKNCPNCGINKEISSILHEYSCMYFHYLVDVARPGRFIYFTMQRSLSRSSDSLTYIYHSRLPVTNHKIMKILLKLMETWYLLVILLWWFIVSVSRLLWFVIWSRRVIRLCRGWWCHICSKIEINQIVVERWRAKQ